MKKYLLTLILAFVLLGLTGCQYNMTISNKTEVDADEFKDFIEDIVEDDEFFEEYEMEFKYTYKSESFGEEGKSTESINFSGRVSINEDEAKGFYKGNKKRTFYEFENGDKVKYTETVKEEGVILTDKSDYDDSESYFKGTYKVNSKYSTTSDTYKTQDESDANMYYLLGDVVENMLGTLGSGSSSAKYYIDGDKGAIVVASAESYKKIIIVLDGNELKGMKIEYKSGSKEYTYEYNIKDVKDIVKPNDASSYDEVDE